MIKSAFALAIVLLLLGCMAPQFANTTKPIAEKGPGQLDRVNTSGLHFNTSFVEVYGNGSTYTTPQRQVYNFSDITTADGKLIVYYFFMSSCSACKATKPTIDRLEAEYNASVVFFRYDLTTINGSWAYHDFTTQYNLSTTRMYVPQVLVNRTIITDMFHINDSLESLIKNFTGSK